MKVIKVTKLDKSEVSGVWVGVRRMFWACQ